MTGMPGLDEIPGLPELPGIGELPESGEAPDSDESGAVEDAQQIDEPFDEETLVPAGTGSGFIVDEEGHVITNAHVIAGAEELQVALFDGTEVDVEVLGQDALLDVAILKLDLQGMAVPGIVTFGDSSALRAGDEVVAIGNALGAFPNTVSQGTVNATDRAFPAEGGLTTMIQHDAEIWHGNSGGPLLNLRGEVVGINTAGIGSGMMGVDTGAADMAFAVEGNTVCNAAADLLANGEIAWPYMGIQGEASSAGQTVVEVVEDGPSAAAGLEAGDVITAFAGQEIDRQNSLIDLLFGHDPGDVVEVTVDRDGALQTFQVTLGERPDATE
jgi:S1-C subfamily serine protease